MSNLKENKDAGSQEIKRETVRKVLQYGMLALLLGLAFALPAYGVNRYARENEERERARQEESGENENAGREGNGEQDESMRQQGAGNQTGNIGRSGVEQDETAGQNGAEQDEAADQGGAAGENEPAGQSGVSKGIIVIDAGHGGDDPGMIGGSGINEKELNLVYARKLEVLLAKAGYEVVQTRPTEEGLYDPDQTHKKAQDMQRRVAIIEEAQPLVTVSIHQNSYPQDSSVCGPQVFYYEQSEEGKSLAECIQNSMNRELEIARPREAKGNASYYILKRSASTTVIVECGFLTNPQEEAKLQEEDYQDRLAQAVCDGVLEYLE